MGNYPRLHFQIFFLMVWNTFILKLNFKTKERITSKINCTSTRCVGRWQQPQLKIAFHLNNFYWVRSDDCVVSRLGVFSDVILVSIFFWIYMSLCNVSYGSSALNSTKKSEIKRTAPTGKKCCRNWHPCFATPADRLSIKKCMNSEGRYKQKDRENLSRSAKRTSFSKWYFHSLLVSDKRKSFDDDSYIADHNSCQRSFVWV